MSVRQSCGAGDRLRRALLISPHFPPDATAGAHRMRVVAPYLAPHGWEPIVLTVAPADYEGTLDPELAAAFPRSVDVIRCPALPVKWTRRVGVGDLGLRALPHLAASSRRLVAERAIDLLYITTYPVYPALIGPLLKRIAGVPFVLDLQDPWVSAWGAEVGPGPGGTADAKSMASRALAERLERLVVPQADALTGVSSAVLDELADRYPALAGRPRVTLPIGISPSDLEWVHGSGVGGRASGVGGREPVVTLRLCYAGTLLPLGIETVRALLLAVTHVLARRADAIDRIRLEFIGTSNQASADAAPRVLPLAREYGLTAIVSERAGRVPFFDAWRALAAADAVLLLGTSEARYTASKLATALASARPVLAIFHEGSDVTRTLQPLAARDPGVELVLYGASRPPADAVPEIAAVLDRWLTQPPPAPCAARAALDPYLGPALAARLAALFDSVGTPIHV